MGAKTVNFLFATVSLFRRLSPVTCLSKRRNDSSSCSYACIEELFHDVPLSNVVGPIICPSGVLVRAEPMLQLQLH